MRTERLIPPPEPADAKRFAEPLAVIRDAHTRQESVCLALGEAAANAWIDALRAEAAAIRRFLTEEWRLHTEDEDQNLFPLLRMRAQSQPEIERILRALGFEHGLDEDLAEFILDDLATLEHGLGPTRPARLYMNLRAYADNQIRHLRWENDVVLPLAQTVLTPADLTAMGMSMARRRGLVVARAG